MRMRAPRKGPCDPIAPLELPHSLHAFKRVSPTDKLNMVSKFFFIFAFFFKTFVFYGHSSTLTCSLLVVNQVGATFLEYIYYVAVISNTQDCL